MSVKIIVPATSANIGPGFDSLGLAVTSYLTVTVVEENVDAWYVDHNLGEKIPHDEENLIVKTALELVPDLQPLTVKVESDIPLTRGLGSSSSAIVAGLMLANYFGNLNLSKQELVQRATEIEGHPDNVAPAIFGGLTVSVMEEHKVTTLSIPVKQDYRYVALIPPFTLSTEKARSVLPQTLDRADAIKNVSHLALMVASLINGYDEGLKLGFKDRFHQPYRGHLIDNFFPIMDVLEKDERVLGAYLSGAGPTIMALIRADDTMGVVRIKEELGSLIDGWQVEKLELDERGFTCDFL